MRLIYILTISLLLASCETASMSALPSSFTTENIMKVHQGMSSGEILKLFGEPNGKGVKRKRGQSPLMVE